LKRDDVNGMILYENKQLDSSGLGSTVGLAYGSGCTLTDIERIKEDMPYINDLPSRRMYPFAYYEKENDD
jgi:hypothetical protein